MKPVEPAVAQKSNAKGFLQRVVSTAKDESVPPWKRKPEKREPVAVQSDPTPRRRWANRHAKAGYAVHVGVCSCKGCACGRGAVPGTKMCNPCARGRHHRSLLERPLRQDRGVPTPGENRKRVRARQQARALDELVLSKPRPRRRHALQVMPDGTVIDPTDG